MEARICEVPFPHLIVDGWLPRHEITEAADAWPAHTWDGWFRYDSPIEQKSACNDFAKMPEPCRKLLRRMMFSPILRAVFDEPTLIPDTTLWGGGMHSMGQGDFLTTHRDANRHARLGMRRALSAVLFVHDVWNVNWGGALELWYPNLSGYIPITPVPGRLVVFACTEQAFHSVGEPLRCPEHVQRKSLATFWFGPDAEGLPVRERAEFVAVPGERYHEEREKARAARRSTRV